MTATFHVYPNHLSGNLLLHTFQVMFIYRHYSSTRSRFSRSTLVGGRHAEQTKSWWHTCSEYENLSVSISIWMSLLLYDRDQMLKFGTARQQTIPIYSSGHRVGVCQQWNTEHYSGHWVAVCWQWNTEHPWRKHGQPSQNLRQSARAVWNLDLVTSLHAPQTHRWEVAVLALHPLLACELGEGKESSGPHSPWRWYSRTVRGNVSISTLLC